MPLSPTLTLADGNTIPQLGLGVYKTTDAEAAAAVETALEAGYRLVDTAAMYENERGVGDAIRRSGIPRDEIIVATKVWHADNGYDSTLRSFDESLARLGLDHLDVYMIHWPAPLRDRYVDTWRAFQQLQHEGRVRSIAVANFHPKHVTRLIDETGIAPVINQVELHPWLPQAAVRAFDAELDIVTQAWSPLARGHALDPEHGGAVLAAIGDRYGKSAAQVVLRWHVQLGNAVVPKSVTPARIRENIDVFDFALDPEDLAAIAALETGERTGVDPDDRN